MASAHIFTVDPTTFNIHLNYMFAGTGAGRDEDSKPEQKGALADILGVRPGDHILFYVAGYGFYGFFKAKQTNTDIVFYEHPENQYLNSDLGGKTLTYRLFIEPSGYGVYKLGVNEWDAMENPENIEDKSVLKMQWAWIFKKLKGGRGCTAIPEEEFQLLRKIVTSNNKRLEETSSYRFSDGEISSSDRSYNYDGCTTISPILSGNIRKIQQEADLRIFFSARAGIDEILDEVLNPAQYGTITYISNETKCSFGMKSIDLFFLTDREKCLLIELKNSFEYKDSILEQISGYARWVSSYKRHLKEIIPILIMKEPRLYPARRGGEHFRHLSESDYHNQTLSPWYKQTIDNILKAKEKLQKFNIDKLSELKAHEFHTNNDDILQHFSSL